MNSKIVLTLVIFTFAADSHATETPDSNDPNRYLNTVRTSDANKLTYRLLAAVKAGDIEKVRASIADGADVNAKDATGRMPIHYAVANKHKEIVELLIDKAVQSNTFEGKELEKVKQLLSQGMDINAQGINDNTLLHYAAQPGYVYVAAYLIEHGANVDAENAYGVTPIQVALQWEEPTTALLFLDAGASTTEMTRNGVLSSAAQNVDRYGSKRTEYEKYYERVQLSSDTELKHDVTVLKASVNNTCVRGDKIPITITIGNQGLYRESFEVLVLDNMSSITNQSVTLAPTYKNGVQDTADIVFEPETLMRSNFGNRVCIGGDVNGDGVADVLVGANSWHNDQGRAYLYFGGVNMDAIADVILTGFSEGDGFSNNQGGAFGDINGDSYDDVIIGARPVIILGRPMPSQTRDGYVSIFYGGPDMDNSPDVVFRSPKTGGEGRFGTVVAGDIDNDGCSDILVGATRRENAYLFWGGDPISTNTETVFQGGNTGNYFSHRMAIGGDVNGDGYNDLIIGARQGGTRQQGQAYLYFGNTKEKIDTDCDWLFTGENGRDNLGSAVDIFDIDNDGYDDVIIASRYASDNWRGQVYIYWGAKNFDGSKPSVVFECTDISSMGEYLQCGYVNDDRYGDILVGGWQYPSPQYKHGRAYLFYGNTKASIDTECDHIFEGDGCTEDYFGFHVGIGDVNGDGHADALVGSPGANHNIGRAYLFFGPFHSTTDITFNWDTTNSSIGKHTLKVEIPPIPGELNTEDNVKTVTIEVKEPLK